MLIDDTLVHFIGKAPPRILPKLDLFVKYLSHKQAGATLRASHTLQNGYGSRVLTEIIRVAGLDVLFTFDDPFDQLENGVIPQLADLEKITDGTQTGVTSRNLFVKSNIHCFEMLIPVRRDAPLLNLPIGIPYSDPKWKAVQPLRMVDISQSGLSFKVYQDVLDFEAGGPSYSIFTIDVVALLAKYLAYYRTLDPHYNRDQGIWDFLHTEVIRPILLQDGVALWLRNLYRQEFLTGHYTQIFTDKVWDYSNSANVGSDYNAAVKSVFDLRTQLVNRNITPQTVYSSLTIGTDGTSFGDWYRQLSDTTHTPMLQQYLWVDAVKNISWWEMIYFIAHLQPSSPDTLSLSRRLKREVQVWIDMRPWQYIRNAPVFKAALEARVYTFYETIDI